MGFRMSLEELFGVQLPVIGVVHLPPLPGAPFWKDSIDSIVGFAVQEALKLREGGVDGIIVENFGDVPYVKRVRDPVTISSMAIIVREVVKSVGIPVGVSFLRNSAIEALAIAYTANAKFIRVNVFIDTLVTDQGIIEPIAPRLQRYRRYLNAWNIKIFADVHCKHGVPLYPSTLRDSIEEAVKRGKPDALIITGRATGYPPDIDDVRIAKEIAKSIPIIVGSGINPQNIVEYAKYADGFIVGTYFKIDGITTNPVDLSRVRKLMDIVKELRSRRS